MIPTFVPMIHLLAPAHWTDYALLDTGNFEKLERFGPVTLIRPEPQAVWPRSSQLDWAREAHARFVQRGSHSGDWVNLHPAKPLKDRWQLRYQGPDYRLTFQLALTAFKHVGIFPEQAANWDFLYSQLRGRPNAKGLNLFAYTGGATLAMRAAGAQATHVDSVKQVVSWANENSQLSGLDGNIRWLVEDALKFVQREARRGAQYDMVVLDPPSFGHGAKGERWKLEDMVDELIRTVAQILSPTGGIVFNCYSVGFSALVLEHLLDIHLPHAVKQRRLAIGELYLPEQATGRKLPTGVYAQVSVG